MTESPSPKDQANPGGALPLTFRIATAIVGVEAVASTGFALYLTLRSAFGHPANRSEGVTIGVYLLILAIGVCFVFAGMLRGRRWSRSPAITANLIVVGMGWYLVSSERPVPGVLVMLMGVATIGILVTPTVNNALEARHTARGSA